ncbi:MAG TPA: VWA domain-containing protein [Vicinamibacterales bacterium]
MLRLVLTAIVAAALSQPQAATQKAPERDPNKIWIDAVFLNSKGTPVTDINRDEVEVWIGHFMAPVEDFISVTPENDAGRPGRYLVLLLDDMTIPIAQVPRVREAARHFVSRMGPDDRMAIVTLDGSGMESTSDHARLLQAIDAYNVRATGVLRPDLVGQQVLTTISAISDALAKAGDQRKTIVAIGRSDVFDRPIPPVAMGIDLKQDWVEAMRAMARANATVYVIDASMLGARWMPDSGNAGFAHASGGNAFIGINDLDGAADRILAEASNYYLIGVKAPPVGRSADLRELQVKLKRRGITIRTREAVSGGR